MTEGITLISREAFLDCISLTEVTLPDSVTEIANLAFFGCESLKEITIPKSVTSISDDAFLGCQFFDEDGETPITDYSDLPGHSYVGDNYSKLVRVPLLNVFFDENGGSVSVRSEHCDIGKRIVLPDYPGIKTGYRFVGWLYNGTEYLPGETIVKTTDGNMRFTAVWENDGTYIVKFNPNDGEVDIPYKKVKYGSAYGELPVPTREWCEFTGWYTEQYGGSLIKETTVFDSTKDIMLFARWELKGEPVVTPVVEKGGNITMTIDYEIGNVTKVILTPKDGEPFEVPAENYSVEITYANVSNAVNGCFTKITIDGEYAKSLKGGDYSFDVYFDNNTMAHADFTVKDHDNTVMIIAVIAVFGAGMLFLISSRCKSNKKSDCAEE